MLNQEGFDLELGIYDRESREFLATSNNRYLDLKNKDRSFDGKLDFAVLQFHVSQELVNKTLQLMFRAVNFTGQDEDD